MRYFCKNFAMWLYKHVRTSKLGGKVIATPLINNKCCERTDDRYHIWGYALGRSINLKENYVPH